MKTKFKILTILLMAILMISCYSTLSKAATTGSLTIIKHETGTDSEGTTYDKKLAGVKFKIYKVNSDYEYTIAASDVQSLTVATADADTTRFTAVQESNSTDSTGTTTISGLAIGRYLVIESYAPENVTSYITPFLVDIPRTNDAGTANSYDVTVEPKNNTVYGKLAVTVTDKNNTDTKLAGVTVKLQVATAFDTDGNPTTWEDYKGTSATATLTTSTDGTGTFDNLPVGTYRLLETSLGTSNTGYILDSKTPSSTFTVSRTTLNGSVTLNNEKPSLTKAITSVAGSTTNLNTASFGDTIAYTLQTNTPANISDLKEFKITDTADTGLTINASSVSISGLAKDTDYTVSVSGQVLTITFDTINVAASTNLTITYNATLTGSDTKTEYKNTAVVAFDTTDNDTVTVEATANATNATTGAASTDPIKVDVGGMVVTKRAKTTTGTLLSGAEFKIKLTKDATTYVKDTSGNDIVLKTGGDGTASYFGLAYGTYYLEETKAPTVADIQYNLLTEPVAFTVNATSYTTTITVVDKEKTTLPATGGIGAAIFVVCGLAFISGGIVLVKKNKKDSK